MPQSQPQPPETPPNSNQLTTPPSDHITLYQIPLQQQHSTYHQVALVRTTSFQTEQHRINERNRKGRERSQRTRRRNAARLLTLQQNCAYLTRENAVLHQILHSILQNQHPSVLLSLLKTLAIYRTTRPPPHIFSSQTAADAAYQPLQVRDELENISLTYSSLLQGNRLPLLEALGFGNVPRIAPPPPAPTTEQSLQESSVSATNQSNVQAEQIPHYQPPVDHDDHEDTTSTNEQQDDADGEAYQGGQEETSVQDGLRCDPSDTGQVPEHTPETDSEFPDLSLENILNIIDKQEE